MVDLQFPCEEMVAQWRLTQNLKDGKDRAGSQFALRPFELKKKST